jgi:hypothetical protein
MTSARWNQGQRFESSRRATKDLQRRLFAPTASRSWLLSVRCFSQGAWGFRVSQDENRFVGRSEVVRWFDEVRRPPSPCSEATDLVGSGDGWRRTCALEQQRYLLLRSDAGADDAMLRTLRGDV